MEFVDRWVELPNGGMEFQDFQLTPEYFLDPKVGDQVVQSLNHVRSTFLLYQILSTCFLLRGEEMLVISDTKFLWGNHEWRRPSPDLAVIPGLQDWENPNFDVIQVGVRPCLIIEVTSPLDPKIRNVDLVDKVDLYEREKIREYLVLDSPQPANGDRFQWIGYRLEDGGRYRALEPDAEGRIVSETVGLAFGVSSDGKTVLVFDARTGERLYTSFEIAAREAEARKDAEDEVTRLREEIARLKGTAG